MGKTASPSSEIKNAINLIKLPFIPCLYCTPPLEGRGTVKNQEMLIRFIYRQAFLTVLMSLNYNSAGKNNSTLRDHQHVYRRDH